MAISTKGSMNSLFNLIYEDAIFVAREQNIMSNLVTVYSDSGWAQRKINTYPTLTAASVSEGVDYANAQDFTKSNLATLTPGEVISQTILTDVRIETDPQDAVRDAATEMGNAIATKIDTDLVGLFSSFTTDVGPGAGQSATLAKVGVGVSILRNAKVPNPVYVVLHPYCWHDIWVLLGQPAANQALLGELANQALRDFYVGQMLNCNWFTNANISADSSDDAISGIFSPQALAFDIRKAPTLEPERDASLRSWELNMVAGYAYGVRRSTFGVKYTCDVSTPS